MKLLAAWVVVVGCLAGCGDNSKQCGEGTNDEDGDNVCGPDGSPDLICGDGTVRDELTLECIPDPSVCGNGTVLINGTCQDPTGGLTVDLEEGPEPNGFEIGSSLAGTIELKPEGEGYVLHGCVKPLDNNSPDLDVYQLDVDGPTLVHVAADGVQGLAAGFIVFGDDPSLSSWFRLGINISSDTSKRELFLPVAGRYQLVMTDTRTLLPITQNGEGFPAAGNPDGSSCYYVTLTQRPIPTPSTLNLATGATGTIGEDLKFFTASFPTGFVGLEAVIDPEDLDGDGFPDSDTLGNLIDSRAASSLVILQNNAVRQIRDADADSPISDAFFGGIKQGDNAVVVLDYVWNYAVGPADFEIQAPIQTSSQALSTTGTAVNDTSNGQFFSLAGEAFFENVNLFHFDVTAAGQIDAMDIAFSIPVQGSIVDQDGSVASPFTGVSGAIHTFTDYEGLIRSIAPGRYYFFVFAPRDPVDTAFTVTSTITKQTPGALALDTAPTQVAFNNVRSNAFVYNAGAEPWQSMSVAATNSTDPVTISIFDPTATSRLTPGFAFGRLDTLVTTQANNPPGTKLGDGSPILQSTLADLPSDVVHRILRNSVAALPAVATNMLIKVNPTVASPTGTFGIEFASRVYEDFGGTAIVAGQSKTANASMTAGSETRFFAKTTPGHRVTIEATPAAGGQPNLDLVIELIDSNELVLDTINLTGADAEETVVLSQNLSGFIAFRVRGASGTSAGAYTVLVTVEADGFTATQTASGFDDACVGGTSVALTKTDPSIDADDEGLSAPIATPTGFALNGAAVGSVVVSSNGFLSVDTNIADARFDIFNLLDAPDVSIAPHWADLGSVSVCTKSVGTKLVVQWEGTEFASSSPVQFQAILDGNGSIEFVYGPFHFADGHVATVGVQDDPGTHALELGSLDRIEVPLSTIRVTPN